MNKQWSFHMIRVLPHYQEEASDHYLLSKVKGEK